MLDILSGGILGSIFGGVFRLAPEVLKWMDKKNERAHELNMFKFQCDLEQQRGAQKLAEIGAQREAAVDVGVMNAFQSAIEQQATMVKAAGGWVASLSASVRPVVTYWVLFWLVIPQSPSLQKACRFGWPASQEAWRDGLANSLSTCRCAAGFQWPLMG